MRQFLPRALSDPRQRRRLLCLVRQLKPIRIILTFTPLLYAPYAIQLTAGERLLDPALNTRAVKPDAVIFIAVHDNEPIAPAVDVDTKEQVTAGADANAGENVTAISVYELAATDADAVVPLRKLSSPVLALIDPVADID